ncbi:hypothetical protein CC1G_14557 [Coprinopsis cinerea okayama7|uniref:Uncharacterized protein n=1 Tax=Coprinopsis cinerea (strain Okayama-7 / 130 / ATCC MYA-4618 / FGSC 9003) TaxID=240176 RepID=D6RMG3_COPC7|nr:hypothetical protein CC1G_14557 [Coprinopsis cinerea okayama7\|eukprot:XP_002911125.1 hypothetical protein CC1G_14557 [Coprinopsis cinerea okayama7\
MGDCCLQYHHLACPAPPSTWPTALVQGRGRSSYLPHDREDCTPPSNKKLATPRQHRLGNYPAASRANTYGVEDGALLVQNTQDYHPQLQDLALYGPPALAHKLARTACDDADTIL